MRVKRIYLRYNRLSPGALHSCKGHKKSLVKSKISRQFLIADESRLFDLTSGCFSYYTH